MADFSNTPWSQFSDSDYKTAEDYCSACLIDENPSGQKKTKANCSLPVREPGGGPYNRNGMAAAAGVLAGARGGVSASADVKRAAARSLARLYRMAGMEMPDMLRRMAGM